MSQAYINEEWKVEYVKGSLSLSEEIFSLREETFVNEKCIMNSRNVRAESDQTGWHVLIRNISDNILLAAVHVLPATLADVEANQSNNSILNSSTIYAKRAAIKKQYRAKGLLQLLIYSLIRIYPEHEYLIFHLQDLNSPIRKFTKAIPATEFKSKIIEDIDNPIELTPFITRTESAMVNCFDKMDENTRVIARKMIFDDINAKLEGYIDDFHCHNFWTKLKNHTLTKNEYLSILMDMHQYVRMTTRTLALAAAYSESRDLRNFYIHHLKEEVDHEKILEADISYLGEDVDYLIHSRPMCKAARTITSLGESVISYRQQPEMYLAVPFLLEGLAGSIEESHLSSIVSCIKSWGVKSPRKAANMLISHAGFDGGHDGHHLLDQKMIQVEINTERKKRELLANMDIVFLSLSEIFDPKSIFNDISQVEDANILSNPLLENVYQTPEVTLFQNQGV